PRGLNRWEETRFSSFSIQDGLPDNSVTALNATRAGRIWITTRAGICKLENGHIEPFRFPAAQQGEQLLGAYEDLRSNLWGFCATYLINLAPDNPAERKRINYFPGEKSASMRVWSFCEGRDGRLWIGASGRGVFSFEGANFQQVMLSEGRWPNDVRTIYEDHEGSLWLGVPGAGLTQLTPQSFVLLKANQGLPAGAATSVALEPGGRILVAMEAGGIYASMGERFERVSEEFRSLNQAIPASLCASADGVVWAGTFGAGLFQMKGNRSALYTTANGLSDDSVLALATDSEKTLWAGGGSGRLHRFSQEAAGACESLEVTSGASITSLLARQAGGFWIGTSDGRLFKTDAQERKPIAVTLSAKLAGKPVLGLCETAEGSLWVGSAGAGLAVLDSGGCSSWGAADGLADDLVFGLATDAEGNLWLSTGKGICRVPRASVLKPRETGALRKARLVFETESSSAVSFGWPRAVRSGEGQLWFATPNGLIGIDTRSWKPEKPAPQVHVETVICDEKPIYPDLYRNRDTVGAEPISISAKAESIEFQFTALSFEAPEKIRFRHKLDKFDADWIEGSERRVRYRQLPSGRYEFHVTACNAEGVWNDSGAMLAFIVPTPLWRTSWALLLYGLTATGGIAGTVRVVSHRRLRQRLLRLEQQQAMERERMRIAQDMHDEIGSKLTKISFLSEMAKGEIRGGGGGLASKVDSIAGTSRELLQALDEIVWAVNPRNDTLEQLGAYLSEYAREYFKNTAVECDVTLQPELPHLAMSAELRHNLFLAFEESLNNVLKHSGASRVRVEIRIENERLMITIGDNGKGFQVPVLSQPVGAPNANGNSSSRNGLVNMRQRLQDIGGEFSMSSEPGKGATVILSVALASTILH
ncbi:MAG TPA: two-component regulator propeller domain-containing protein, partial [Candidatus Dormibacteraeota bacterium]|nr:two-component regulator propeller domain-containing protein [Candidatus Dormibacteraeota bacterium]